MLFSRYKKTIRNLSYIISASDVEQIKDVVGLKKMKRIDNKKYMGPIQ